MRLDAALVARGLAPTRARAQAAIEEGRVTVNGARAAKAAQRVAAAAVVIVEQGADFVSRGALKLAAALDAFAIDVTGAVAIDLGASTGGFTDLLLRRGAARVYAIDVGHGQLDASLRGDARVIAIEGMHGRDVSTALIAEAIDLVVCDVSFISLMKALAPSLALARRGARAAALVKPQFELGREKIGKGGIVRADAADYARLRADIEAWFEAAGWSVDGWIDSPVAGGDGERELLIGATKR
jgi:23S rRNA (cytidine1920-2'-O)/16S rRNA (cytidine1409-2'-O)-methyltransferase